MCVRTPDSLALLYIVEDNEAVIKIIIEGRSPTMRHVSRTHKVVLDLLMDWEGASFSDCSICFSCSQFLSRMEEDKGHVKATCKKKEESLRAELQNCDLCESGPLYRNHRVHLKEVEVRVPLPKKTHRSSDAQCDGANEISSRKLDAMLC